MGNTHSTVTGNKLAFTREGAHSRDRILHAHGDLTGREIGRMLVPEQIQHEQPHDDSKFATELLVENGRVTGVTM